jgi:hypothetical protein
MALTEEQMKQLAGQSQLGNFFSLSPTLKGYGQDMQSLAEKKLITEQEDKNARARRVPINLGQGILFDPKTNETMSNEEYQKALEAEHKRKMTEQAAKDAAALERARIQGQRSANQMPAGERKLYRLSKLATETLPQILQSVKANPAAFGTAASVSKYLPDVTPNVISEYVKNRDARKRTDTEQAARNAVFQQAYQTINELAGAALSEHEANRIEQFLPRENDDARTIVNKLGNAIETANRMHNSFGIYGGVEMLDTSSTPSPKVVTEQTPQQAAPTGKGKQPVGEPISLSDGTVWQEYSDGTHERVQ